jgi:hypothetical protein
VKVFEDHLYFLKYDSGDISVLSYNHYPETKELKTKEEVLVKLTNMVTKSEIECNFSPLLLVKGYPGGKFLNLVKPLR